MNYLVVGVNHRTAPVAVRERLSFAEADVPEALRRLRGISGMRESAVLSTCNRVEVYGAAAEPDKAFSGVAGYLAGMIKGSDITPYLYSLSDRAAVAHLFEVTSSLDALVVGENQIARQVREAHRMAVDCDAAGPYLNRLFHRAFFVAKRVKTETELGRGNVSVGSVAVGLARKIFGDLSDRTVLLFGAGEIGELVLRHLHESVAGGRSFIVNRNPEKAEVLERDGLGEARPMEAFEPTLLESDILVTSLSGDPGFLNPPFFSAVMAKRGNAPLFVVDLGVPRNVDPSVAKIPNVYLYNVDDLEGVAKENRAQRKGEIASAQNIIDEEARLFYDDHLGLEALPTIADLNRKFDEIRRREFDKTLAKMTHLSDADRGRLEAMTKAIIARVLHDPILTLKRAGASPSPVQSLLRKIFSLDDEG